MTARVLVVDDIITNVKLLEAKLAAEYFEVVSASNGPDALKRASADKPDIILLDVMMPGMDGFEVCRRLKASADTAHIPVVMVTALDQAADRVQGLEAGADDFLTKPVNDIALFARVKSLVRLKMMTDELRMREETGQSLGVTDPSESLAPDAPGQGGRVLLIEDRNLAADRLSEALSASHTVKHVHDAGEAMILARGGDFDLAILSLSLQDADGMRLLSQLKTFDATRHVPILVLVDEGDPKRLLRALELGANDYLIRPIDRNELSARVRTQLKRKRYADRLRQNLQLSVEMAVTDQLTGLHNRRYMTRHLETLLTAAKTGRKPLSLLVLDIDFFKSINDTFGHDGGDVVLREFANRLQANVRGIDLACRFGGEEFVVVMPDTDTALAYGIAERLRTAVAERPFVMPGGAHHQVTVSIGVTGLEGAADDAELLFKRADQALYRAKRDGRNRVVAEAA